MGFACRGGWIFGGKGLGVPDLGHNPFPDSDRIVAKIDTVSAEGTPTSSNVRYRRDGKEYPYEAPAGKGTIAVTSMNRKYRPRNYQGWHGHHNCAHGDRQGRQIVHQDHEGYRRSGAYG
jgi:hypothetical protein